MLFFYFMFYFVCPTLGTVLPEFLFGIISEIHSGTGAWTSLLLMPFFFPGMPSACDRPLDVILPTTASRCFVCSCFYRCTLVLLRNGKLYTHTKWIVMQPDVQSYQKHLIFFLEALSSFILGFITTEAAKRRHFFSEPPDDIVEYSNQLGMIPEQHCRWEFGKHNEVKLI